MRWILFLLSGLAFLIGLGAFASAQTIFQEIVGCISFVLCGVLFSGAAVVDALVSLQKEIRKINRPTETRTLGTGQM